MASQHQIELSIKGWEMMPHLFETWDTDSSGAIDRDELVAGMTRMIKENKLHLTESSVKSIMQEVDLNDDHVLDRREFGCFVSRVADTAGVNLDTITSSLVSQLDADARRKTKVAQRAWSEIPELFNQWDYDNKRSVSRDEVIMAFHNLATRNGKDGIGQCNVQFTLADCLRLAKECDSDGNRVLDIREFGAFIEKFSFITGVPMDRIVDNLTEECKRMEESIGGRQFSAVYAKVWVGMAEEALTMSEEVGHVQAHGFVLRAMQS